MSPGIVYRFEVINIDQRQREGLMIVHQGGDIAIKCPPILAVCQGVHRGLPDPDLLPFFATDYRFAQHRLQLRRLLHIPGFNCINDIEQDRAGSVVQIQTEQDDCKSCYAKSPTDHKSFIAQKIFQCIAGYHIDSKPVRIGQRAVIKPDVTFFIMKHAIAAVHLFHSRLL